MNINKRYLGCRTNQSKVGPYPHPWLRSVSLWVGAITDIVDTADAQLVLDLTSITPNGPADVL